MVLCIQTVSDLHADPVGMPKLLLAFIVDVCPHMHHTHWRSSHYAVTHVRNKNSNIHGRSHNVVKVIYHTIRNCS